MTEGTEHEEPTVDETAAGDVDVAEEVAADVGFADMEDAPGPVDDDGAPEAAAAVEAEAEVAETEAEPTVVEIAEVADVAEGEEGPVQEAAVEPEAETTEPEDETPSAPEAEAAEGEEGDDVTAAIAAAGENIEAETSLDSIAPGTVATAAAAPAVEPAAKANSVSIWPFFAYDVVWAAFAGALVWQMHDLPAGGAVWQAVNYPYYVLGGVVLTVAGPLMILAVWIASWGKPGSTKGGQLISALIKGSIATLLGVLMWWAALLALDQIRFGSLL